MTAPEPLRPLLDTLMDVRRTAFEIREHEGVFHVLSAAAHAAEDLGGLDVLEEIHRLSRESLAWIDIHQPDHRHSTASARLRSQQSIFEQLAVTAMGMRQRIKSDRRLEELRSQP